MAKGLAFLLVCVLAVNAVSTYVADVVEITEVVEFVQEAAANVAAELTPSHAHIPRPRYSWAVPAIYDWVQPFSNGYALVMAGGLVGVVDAHGQEVIPAIYEQIGNFEPTFEHGFIEAQLNSMWGVLDMQGNVILDFEFDEAFVVSQNLARIGVGDWNQRYFGLIDFITGQEIVPLGLYHGISQFAEGMAAVYRYIDPDFRSLDDTVWGFIDLETGEETVSLMYTWARPFANGQAQVRYNELWGAIDAAGEIAIPIIYEDQNNIGGDYEETGIIRIESADGLWGVIDADTGDVLVEKIYYTMHLLGYDRAVGSLRTSALERTLILIDITTGEELAELDGWPAIFHNGVATISTGDVQDANWAKGLIDLYGNEILPLEFFNIFRFTDDLLVVGEIIGDDWLYGIKNISGNTVLAAQFDDIRPTSEGFAWINIGGELVDAWEYGMEIAYGRWGIINAAGQIIMPPTLEFERIGWTAEGLTPVQIGGLWGFVRVNP